MRSMIPNLTDVVLYMLCFTLKAAFCERSCKASASFKSLNASRENTIEVKDGVGRLTFTITQLCLPKYFAVNTITASIVKDPPANNLKPFCQLNTNETGFCQANNGCRCTGENMNIAISRNVTQHEMWLIVGHNNQSFQSVNLTISVIVSNGTSSTTIDHDRGQIATKGKSGEVLSPVVTVGYVQSTCDESITGAESRNDTMENNGVTNENTPEMQKNAIPFMKTKEFIIIVSVVAVMFVLFIVVFTIVCASGKREKNMFLNWRDSSVIGRTSAIFSLVRLGAPPPVPIATAMLDDTGLSRSCIDLQRAASMQSILSGNWESTTGSKTPHSQSKAALRKEVHNTATTTFANDNANAVSTQRPLHSTVNATGPYTNTVVRNGKRSVNNEFSKLPRAKMSSSSTGSEAEQAKAEVSSEDQRDSSTLILDWPAPPAPLSSHQAGASNGLCVNTTDPKRQTATGRKHTSTILKVSSAVIGQEIDASSQLAVMSSAAARSKTNSEFKTDTIGYLVPFQALNNDDFI